jgi:protein phosphatase
MKIVIPEGSLVALIGSSGSGKSTFAHAHFKPTEVLSSDFFRGIVSDSENDQTVTSDAFEALHFVAAKRLANGRLTVIDATNVQLEARKPILALARDHDVLPVAIVLNLPEAVCQERNRGRADRDFGPHVIRMQLQHLRRSLKGLQREGFRYVYVLSSPEEVANATIERQPLWTDRRDEHGPFDIIGDIHGCYDELVALLNRLGYAVEDRESGIVVEAPAGRKLIFLGDLVDRGPRTPDVLRLVMSMVARGQAMCVPGNHDVKLMRALQGRKVTISHGLAESLAQLAPEPPEFRDAVVKFIDGLISHYVLDNGRLVVAHAGMKQQFQGRASRRVRDFALYGETTGETDDYGLPVRYNWAAEYRGKAKVVYGHTPIGSLEWQNNTICLDTGCVFGGSLTALRYPENDLVSVPAARVYYEPARPLSDAGTASSDDGLLDLNDVIGKRVVTTELMSNVTIRAENAAAALEVMSRFAVDPRWLIYLPPTMSPSETSARPDLLEHPDEAFAYFRSQGVERVVCEVKHMGSRAIVIAGQSAGAIEARFGIQARGIVYTRTGRRFFDDAALEQRVIDAVVTAMDASDLWQELGTDWICLDCEIMPWSLKAQELIEKQYTPIGIAATHSTAADLAALRQAAERGVELGNLEAVAHERSQAIAEYRVAAQRFGAAYVSPDDVHLAPFHLLATEGAVHADKPHAWHMQMLSQLSADGSELMQPTEWREVDLLDEASTAGAVEWWENLTADGAEGIVIKPAEFVARNKGRLVQPALKCRGREYLRIIYGPEYTLGGNLGRLRSRAVNTKRSLAAREFALGVEALQRFVKREPLWRVHEAVFGVLALESEPVDPRL